MPRLKMDQAVRSFQFLVLGYGTYILWDFYQTLMSVMADQDSGKHGALGNHIMTLCMLIAIVLLLRVWQQERIRLRETIEAIGDGFALFSKERSLIQCNSAFAKIYAASPTDLERWYIRDILFYAYQQGKGFDTKGQPFDTWMANVYPRQQQPYYRTSEMGTWDGRCFLVTERITSQGELVMVHTDITDQQHQKEELRRLATYDGLTGVFNRRFFIQTSEEVLLHCRLGGYPLALMMLDVDHFKLVNDTYGHAAGDDVLRELAQVTTHFLRKVDLVGRLGGEEFALLLPNTDEIEAKTVAERLRCRLKALMFDSHSGQFTITVSIGVALLSDRDSGLNTLLERADTHLYQAKRMGRDRVCCSLDTP